MFYNARCSRVTSTVKFDFKILKSNIFYGFFFLSFFAVLCSVYLCRYYGTTKSYSSNKTVSTTKYSIVYVHD